MRSLAPPESEPREKSAIDPLKGKSAGKALQRVFHQEELHKHIEEQKASVSHLMNEARRRLFVHLCANPCDHVRGVARAFDLSAPAATWHLNVLADCRYISKKSFKKKNIYWPSGMLKSEDLTMVALMREPNTRPILTAVMSGPGGKATEAHIVGEVRLSQQNTNLWLGQLVDGGLLKKDGNGPGTFYTFTERAFTAVDFYKSKSKTFSQSMVELFESDGLRPRKARFRGSRLHVEISLPGGKERVMLECNPLADLARILK